MSYKFYHHVLAEDKTNVYAANGLAMVCAEKAELDVAREIFSRVSAVQCSAVQCSAARVSTARLVSDLMACQLLSIQSPTNQSPINP